MSLCTPLRISSSSTWLPQSVRLSLQRDTGPVLSGVVKLNRKQLRGMSIYLPPDGQIKICHVDVFVDYRRVWDYSLFRLGGIHIGAIMQSHILSYLEFLLSEYLVFSLSSESLSVRSIPSTPRFLQWVQRDDPYLLQKPKQAFYQFNLSSAQIKTTQICWSHYPTRTLGSHIT